MAALTSPVCQVVRKYRDHRRKQREISRRDVTERELHDIQKKIVSEKYLYSYLYISNTRGNSVHLMYITSCTSLMWV